MKLPKIILPFVASTLFACSGSVETIGDDADGGSGSQSPGEDPRGSTEPGEPADWDDPAIGGGEPGIAYPEPIGVGGGLIGGGTPLQPGEVRELPAIDPATCEEGYQWNEREYCEKEVSCGDTWAYAWCDSWETGNSQCWCDRQGLGINVNIDGSVGDGEACERVMEACLGATSVEVTGEPECSNDYVDQGRDYCSTNLSCETPLDVGGLPASVHSWSDTWCEYWDNQWQCECYSGNSSGRVVFEENLGSPEVCYSSIDACSAGLIDPTQPSSCSPRSQWAEQDYCNFELECSQSRTIDGAPAEVSAWQHGYCMPDGAGNWSCDCGNGETFDLTGDSAWTICTDAALRCGD